MLQRMSEKYSVELVEVVGNTTEVNPNRRASLMEVQRVLDGYWGSECDDLDKMETDEHESFQGGETSERQPLQNRTTNQIASMHQSLRSGKKHELALPGEV